MNNLHKKKKNNIIYQNNDHPQTNWDLTEERSIKETDDVNTTRTGKDKLEATSSSPINLSNLPDEQDRKRIVGCLAGVLAASYLDRSDEKQSTSSNELQNFGPIESYHSDSYSLDYGDASTISHSNSNETIKHGEISDDPHKTASDRHRKRNHEVHWRILHSSSSLLFLDKSHSLALAPMLSKLTHPLKKGRCKQNSKSSSTLNNNTKMKASQVEQLRVDTKSPSSSDSTSIIDGIELQSNTRSKIPSQSQCSTVSVLDCDSSSSGSTSSFLNEINDESETTHESILDSSVDSDECGIRSSDECDQDAMMNIIAPFLYSLSPGSGFQCIALLMLQHLLHSSEGYDARTRSVFKKLAVIVLSHEMRDQESNLEHNWYSCVDKATRKFEVLEQAIAVKLLSLSEEDKLKSSQIVSSGNRVYIKKKSAHSKILRGLKIGSTGVVAGALLAITGGLAAPGIAAGVAAIAGSTAAATVAVSALTSTAAVTTIFGVGGGGFYAYKMQRRTKGLTEFTFQNESKNQAELFRTICLSGWLRDEHDFQRPWGVTPTSPPVRNKIELLQQFYYIHRPEYVSRVERILALWKGEERQLWCLLQEKYGCDPDHIRPIEDSEILSNEEDEILTSLLKDLGYTSSKKYMKSLSQKFQHKFAQNRRKENKGASSVGSEISNRKLESPANTRLTSPTLSENSIFFPTSSASSKSTTSSIPESFSHVKSPQPWDYQSQYAGELYTIKWEVDLLLELCNSVTDFAVDLVGHATKEILRHTALTTLLAAIALPVALISAANMLDETWSLAITRAEQAGLELANCLLESKSGRRPVTFIGFSMGARVIYSCLKELARLQEKWEDQRETYENRTGTGDADDTSFFQSKPEPASIVEDVILMGMPNHLSIPSWKACRRIVAGRFINCYSRKDMVLSLMFSVKRMSGVMKPICGTSPVNIVGVENYDVTNFVSSHVDYCHAVNDILRLVNHGRPFASSNCNDLTREFCKQNQIPSPPPNTPSSQFCDEPSSQACDKHDALIPGEIICSEI